MNVLKRS